MKDYAIVDVRLDVAPDGSVEYGLLLESIARSIRTARSEAYGSRRQGTIRGNADIFFVLDRRINWRDSDLLNAALTQLGTPYARGRNPDSDQWVVYSVDGKITCKLVHKYSSVGENDHDIDAVVSRLRQFELLDVVQEGGVLFHHRGNALFLLPNGEISDFFFRAGNLQKSRRSVEIVCFWCLEYAARIDHILCDTWSISTLGAALAQFVKAYWQTVGEEHSVTWSYLGEYPIAHPQIESSNFAVGDTASESRHVRDVLQQAKSRNGNVLFLSSASASGRLVDEVRELAQDFSVDENLVSLVLFSLRPSITHADHLCDLSTWLGSMNIRGVIDPTKIEDVTRIVRVDPQTYIPDYRVSNVTKFSTAVHDRSSKPFFEKYSGNQIFSVNRKGRTSRRSPGRHYSYHVDVDKLFAHPAFVAALKERLADLKNVNAIVFLSSTRNSRFSELALSALTEIGVVPSDGVHEVSDVKELGSGTTLGRLLEDSGKQILFVEAVLVSGANMREIATAIRKAAASGRSILANLVYLVGLSRPYSNDKSKWTGYFSHASDHPGYSAEVQCVEEVVLPLFPEAQCPWVRERIAHERAIEKLANSDSDRGYITNRIRILRESRDTGLIGPEVFFQRYGDHKFVFWNGSLFLDRAKVVERNAEHGIDISADDVSEADLVCAVASAIQAWRSESSDDTLQVQKVSISKDDLRLNDEVTVGQTGFNETMLRAAIWRSMKPSELSVKNSGSDASTLLAEIVLDHGNAGDQWQLGGEAALIFGWRIRQVLTEEQIELVDWNYLMRLADEIVPPFQ